MQLVNPAAILPFPKHDFQFHCQTQELPLIPQCVQNQDQSQGTLCSSQAPSPSHPHVLSHLLTISPLQWAYEFSFSPLFDNPALVLPLPK